MVMEPNNPASEAMYKAGKKWFFCIEPTAETSPIDLDEMMDLLEVLAKRYNMRWCQAFWKPDSMDEVR